MIMQQNVLLSFVWVVCCVWCTSMMTDAVTLSPFFDHQHESILASVDRNSIIMEEDGLPQQQKQQDQATIFHDRIRTLRAQEFQRRKRRQLTVESERTTQQGDSATAAAEEGTDSIKGTTRFLGGSLKSKKTSSTGKGDPYDGSTSKSSSSSSTASTSSKGKGTGKGGSKGSYGRGGKGTKSSKKGGKKSKSVNNNGYDDDNTSGDGGNDDIAYDDESHGNQNYDNDGDDSHHDDDGYGSDDPIDEEEDSTDYEFALVRDEVGTDAPADTELDIAHGIGLNGRVFQTMDTPYGLDYTGDAIGLFKGFCTVISKKTAELLCTYEIYLITEGETGVGGIIATGSVGGVETGYGEALVTGAEFDFAMFDKGLLTTVQDPKRPVLYAQLSLS